MLALSLCYHRSSHRICRACVACFSPLSVFLDADLKAFEDTLRVQGLFQEGAVPSGGGAMGGAGGDADYYAAGNTMGGESSVVSGGDADYMPGQKASVSLVVILVFFMCLFRSSLTSAVVRDVVSAVLVLMAIEHRAQGERRWFLSMCSIRCDFDHVSLTLRSRERQTSASVRNSKRRQLLSSRQRSYDSLRIIVFERQLQPCFSLLQTTALLEEPVIDPNEPLYCHCQRVSFGEMVACENEECPVEWFHFACVGLKEQVRPLLFHNFHHVYENWMLICFISQPKGKWYCSDDCRNKVEGKRLRSG